MYDTLLLDMLSHDDSLDNIVLNSNENDLCENDVSDAVNTSFTLNIHFMTCKIFDG